MPDRFASMLCPRLPAMVLFSRSISLPSVQGPSHYLSTLVALLAIGFRVSAAVVEDSFRVSAAVVEDTGELPPV